MTNKASTASANLALSFPIKIELSRTSEVAERNIITLNSGLTTLLGPNGSGKTQLLRSLKEPLKNIIRRPVKFISAGRIGVFEQYRSVSSIYNAQPTYENATFGQLNERDHRHQIETLQAEYQTLAARPDIRFKVRERLLKIFNRDINLFWDNGQLKANFVSKDKSSEYSSAREASGILHFVGILTALYDDDIGALLLDEPEVSLHPQLQAFLLREIVAAAGLPGERYKKLIIISTHSTEFLCIEQPSALTSMIFCRGFSDDVVQISRDAGELKDRKLGELISRIGQEHKLAFFARSPLLVEGPSDTIVCAGLANKLNIHIEAGGSQLVPVIGKGQLPAVIKLMRMMGKEPVTLADADAFTDSNQLARMYLTSPSADDKAAKNGHRTAMELFQRVHADFCAAAEAGWIEIEAYAKKSLYWDDSVTGGELTLMKRRSAFTALFSHSSSEIGGPWPALKSRIEVLLELLESQGCFLLVKGTIEAYYSSPVGGAGRGKPSAAAEEVLAIQAQEDCEVEERYLDVVRCLRKAAAGEEISEADIIQDALLSVAAPILARLRNKTLDANIDFQVRSLGEEGVKLFDFKVDGDKLIIDIKSNVLDVNGFPITVSVHEDIVSNISAILHSGSKASA
jgi:hypothetical protein